MFQSELQERLLKFIMSLSDVSVNKVEMEKVPSEDGESHVRQVWAQPKHGSNVLKEAYVALIRRRKSNPDSSNLHWIVLGGHKNSEQLMWVLPNS